MRFAILVLSAATLACSLLSNREDSYAVANGQTLHYTCRGDASKPTVLFESAIGGDESLWKIADRVSDRAYACTYDRAGNGRSNKPTQALTARDHVDQLHALLAAAHIKAPVVFVGHSYGGLVGYLLALVHPEDVSALALVDASHPQQEERFRAAMNDQQRAIYDAGYADFPYVDFSTSLAQVGAEYRSLGDLPLLVMTASRGLLGEDCTEGLPCERMQQIWLDVQRDYAAQSSNSRQIVVDSGHYIQDAQPDVVVDEIFDLIARAQAS